MSRVVVVTGASAGVGRAAALAFGERGDAVALLARGTDGLEAARREVESVGGRALAIPTDVADADQVEAAAERAETELGPIDVWVNDAMTTVFAPFKEIGAGEYRRATEVSYLGYVWGTMSALRRMLPRDRGTIVQVGSALAYRAIPLQAAYCGAKFAIRGFTDTIRTELLHDGSSVHITMVQLPAVNTPQFNWCKTRLPGHPQPVPPIYQPEVAAEAIAWAAEHRRRELWVAGSTVKAIVGNKLAPGLADRYLGRTGYSSQQTAEQVDGDRPANLFEPVQGEHATHGKFDAGARGRSPELWVSQHRSVLAGAAAAVAGLAGIYLLAR
jgi:NAD(P)-dependent dehydrogenase (short-subunit alcohol dehydrogenase family)